MPTSAPQKKTINKRASLSIQSKRAWSVFRSTYLHIANYLSYLYLLNPVHYIREREKSMYYNDTNGHIPFKPRLKERVVNLLLSEKKRRSNILAWIKSKAPGHPVEDFTSSWHDGILLCTLLESVLPGCCPGYKNLKTHNRVNNCRLGIKLAHQYLEIPQDILTPEEMAIADKRTERKIFNLVSTVKWATENKSKNAIKILGQSTILQPSSCCSVQGSGLISGVVGRKMKFSVNISNVFGMFDLLLQLKGPRNEVYSEKIVSLHQSSEAILNNKNKIAKRITPDQKVLNGEAKVLAYLEDGHGNTYVRWKNVKQYGGHAVYNVFDFNCTCSKEGCFAMSFTPVSAGIHTVSIRWQDKQVQGSPFKVKVYKLSDVNRRSIVDTKEKRVLFESLSLSFDGSNPTLSLNDQSNKNEIPNNKDDATTYIQVSSKLQPRMRKQYTVKKRRILKKVITRNGEEIIITESPTPPMSRQNSITDISDYTDDDGSAIRSGSSSPAFLRAAKDLSELRRQSSGSSSPSKHKENMKTSKLNRITEKELNFSDVSGTGSSLASTSFVITDQDSCVSSMSAESDKKNDATFKNQISQKFLDSCLQSLAKLNVKRQNSESVVPKCLFETDTENRKEHPLSKLTLLNRSLSESRLEDNILKRYVCSKGNVMSRDDSDIDTHSSSNGSLNLKLLHSGSLRKACFYISEKAVTQTFSLVSNDCRSDSSPAWPDSSNCQTDDVIEDTGNKAPMISANDHSLRNMNDDYDQIEKFNLTTNNTENLSKRRNLTLNNEKVSKINEALIPSCLRNDTDIINHTEKPSHAWELTNSFKIPNICNEDDFKMKIENWLENSALSDKLPSRRTRSTESTSKKKYNRSRTFSSDSRKESLQKQRSIFPHADNDPSLDGHTVAIQMNALNDDRTGSKNLFTNQTIRSDYTYNVKSQPENATVFRAISDGKYDQDLENQKLGIIVPKVKRDKGTVVCAAQIVHETGCHSSLFNISILRRRICKGMQPIETNSDPNVSCGLIVQENLPCTRNERSLSIDASTLVFSGHLEKLRLNMSDQRSRDHNVRAWIEQTPHCHRHPPYRQSTVDTIDSGMGDDNGIKSGRRASLYSHFRYSSDNQHQTVCRRPYKGEITLDPKLVQIGQNTTTANTGKETNSADRDCNDRYTDDAVFNGCSYKEGENTIIQNGSASSLTGKSLENNILQSSSPLSKVKVDLKTIPIDDVLHTQSSNLSKQVSATSSLSVDEMNSWFGVNRNDREDLLNQLNNFQNLDSSIVNASQLDAKTDNESFQIDHYGKLSEKLSLSDECSSFSSNSETSNFPLQECDVSRASIDSVPRYVSSIEYPFYFQLNDVIVKNANPSYQSHYQIDCKDENDSLSSVTQSDYEFSCKADGAGLIEGHVGVKNNFQVWTNEPNNGSLSVTIYGPKSHSVVETCVMYTGDNLYEVIYEVKNPGIYIICVKWSEQNIPNSPFTCRISY